MALSSAQIKKIQGIVGVTADGVWGPLTKAAVKRWQTAHGLTPDGVVGPLTSAKMGLSGAGGTGGSAGTKSTTKGPSSAEMTKFAEDYGYQLSFLKSDKELYGIFQKAMTGKWDATRFVAAVKASKWYKTHGEAYRQNLALKTTDPATYNQRLNSQIGSVGDMAGAMGALIDPAGLRKIAEDSVMFGWNDSQVRSVLASKIKPGSYAGESATIKQKLRETAYRNGFNVSNQALDHWNQQIAAGNETVEGVQQRYRQMYGARLAPGFQKELQSGMDLFDIASPYMQTMAQTLELNPADIDLFDPTIRKALAGDGQPAGKDGSAGTPSMWQFEQNLRQDKRFLKTKQAQDQTMAVGNKVLQDFGLIK